MKNIMTISSIKAPITFHFSCAAKSVFSYCKFRSSAGEKCSFHNNNNNNNNNYRHGTIFEEFCDELKNRTVFSGSSKVHCYDK